jgi:hypothetical protein
VVGEVGRRTGPVLVAVVGLGCLGTPALADVTGSAHDVAGSGWAGGEICKPGHTPHFADMSIGFLWSHEMSTLSYTLYDGSVTAPGTSPRSRCSRSTQAPVKSRS